MELRGIKRAGERLDSGRPEKKRRVEDYRRDAGLTPDAPQTLQESLETPRTFKIAWAVDQARSELDQHDKQRSDQAENVRYLFRQLEGYVHDRDDIGYTQVFSRMEEEKHKNRYIDKILETMDYQSRNSIKTQFEYDVSKDELFIKRAKDLFNDLADTIEKRNIEKFNQIESQLASEKETNEYISKGMDAYTEAIKKADKEAAKITEEAQHEADERRKRQQEQEQDNDRMDTSI